MDNKITEKEKKNLEVLVENDLYKLLKLLEENNMGGKEEAIQDFCKEAQERINRIPIETIENIVKNKLDKMQKNKTKNCKEDLEL